MTIPLSQFLVRPRPRTAESVRGYVHRLYVENGHYIRLRGKSRTWYECWLRGIGREDECNALERSFAGAGSIHPKMGRICSSEHKYCSRCARELGYQTWYTDYAQVLACPIHLIRLRNTCQVCGTPTNADSLMRCKCDCGAPLATDVGEQPVPAAWATWELILSRHDENGALPRAAHSHWQTLAPWMQMLTVPEATELVFWLQTLTEAMKFPDAHLAARQALVSWPSQFQTLLSRVLQRRGSDAFQVVDRRYLLAGRLGFAKFISRKHCSEVATQIECFFDARRVSPRRSVGAGELYINPGVRTYSYVSRTLIRGEAIAEELGWTVQGTEATAVALGLPVIQLPNRHLALECDLAKELTGMARGYVPCEQAADSLGISVNALFHLMHIAKVQPRCIELRARQGSSGPRPLKLVSLRSCDELHRAIYDRCRRLAPDDAVEWTPLCHMVENSVRAIKGRRRSRIYRARIDAQARNRVVVAEALEAILRGNLRAFCVQDAKSISDVLVTLDRCDAVAQEAPL